MTRPSLALAAIATFAACQSRDNAPAPGTIAPVAPVAVDAVPASWCLSTAPDGTQLILDEVRIIPVSDVTPAQLAATPPCAPVISGEPL